MNNSRIAAIVVTYEPSDGVSTLLNSLSGQVDNIIIIDNNSANFVIENSNHTHFIRLPKNEGIASAQNHGIILAEKLDHDFVVFFDQDSIVPEGMISDLFTNYINLEETGIKLAAVGPIFQDYRFKFIYPQIKLDGKGVRTRITPEKNSPPFEVSFIISSGSLMKLEVLKKIGLMKSEYFIDYVDTEWCMRAGHEGYKIYSIPTSRMDHAIGDDNIVFLKYKLPVHSPWRRYYRMRNMYYLFKLPYIPVLMKLREFIINNAHQLLLIFFSPGKRISYLKYWFKSQIDGLKILFHS
ncbi:glycosyltransferase family 2 protein [Erwinia sp. MMLR14_017]|uniref:glycosyltransferase family 2 protein n=1 Tax=Erwinia sp. MMLR14_017 TaxID=3093842 RepID=UPI00299023E2|nr:glycosyltransferase family 2 protein [Erwinia sp. MMLR14_017]MDW8847217.1 glycosyltransferase family 2 protein [Erwinia sp. MMLR14_017]